MVPGCVAFGALGTLGAWYVYYSDMVRLTNIYGLAMPIRQIGG